MSFRTRLFLALLLAVLIPLGALAYGVRSEMERRLTTEYQERTATLVRVITADLGDESRAVAARLRALVSDLSQNDRFRLAAVRREPASRRYLLDYAGYAMRLSGLALMQIQDSSGRILSSGHFRNEFDRLQPELPAMLKVAGGLALVRSRTPDSTILALARIDSFRVAGVEFTLVGGAEAGTRLSQRLSPGGDLAVELVAPSAVPPDSSRGARVVRELPIPYLDLVTQPPRLDTARFVVTQSLGTIAALRKSVDRWFAIALALTLAGALIAAAWISSRISRPLRELARKTSQIDLDRLDQSFESERSDEIGSLSRLLGAMTDRLRTSTAALREAERRAAVGDIARQVNHDIKNGLAPIRNVLRHLSQVAGQEPAGLPRAYEARRQTLESSIEYLENLARNYARLSPGLDQKHCDVNAVVGQVLRDGATDGMQFRAQLGDGLPPVWADDVVLRRILENVVGNAVESLAGQPGTVTVSTGIPQAHPYDRVTITVTDTGPGMSREQLDRAFNDFYTTKPGGTGLGLSIVRRLIQDLNGSLRVETEPGAGTCVMIELPAGAPASGTQQS
ncbi:MAG TPA: HAMP domain-containing sensor histidine kinase [Gemmatimonadales bacterium]|nr:HAMP domain-containing sensor histidine kinase [Gemmatimonadales bacterium]